MEHFRNGMYNMKLIKIDRIRLYIVHGAVAVTYSPFFKFFISANYKPED